MPCCNRTSVANRARTAGLAAPWALTAVLLASAILSALAFFGRRSCDRACPDRYSWAGMLALGGFSALMELTLVPRRRLATGVAMKAAAGDRLVLAVGCCHDRRLSRAMTRDVAFRTAQTVFASHASTSRWTSSRLVF